MTSSSNTRDNSTAQQAQIVVAAVTEFACNLHHVLSLAASRQLDGRNDSSSTSSPVAP